MRATRYNNNEEACIKGKLFNYLTKNDSSIIIINTYCISLLMVNRGVSTRTDFKMNFMKPPTLYLIKIFHREYLPTINMVLGSHFYLIESFYSNTQNRKQVHPRQMLPVHLSQKVWIILFFR